MDTPSKDWKLINQKKGDDLKIFTVRFDQYLNLRNNQQITATVLNSDDAVNVVALTSDQKIILVEQFRFGIEATTLELPGGFVDLGEDKLIAAKRELQEETGYTGQQWKYLGYVGNNPSYVTGKVHHYLLEGAKLDAEIKLDIGENIKVVALPLSELKTLLANNKIIHPHTISALAMVFNIFGGIEL